MNCCNHSLLCGLSNALEVTHHVQCSKAVKTCIKHIAHTVSGKVILVQVLTPSKEAAVLGHAELRPAAMLGNAIGVVLRSALSNNLKSGMSDLALSLGGGRGSNPLKQRMSSCVHLRWVHPRKALQAQTGCQQQWKGAYALHQTDPAGSCHLPVCHPPAGN